MHNKIQKDDKILSSFFCCFFSQNNTRTPQKCIQSACKFCRCCNKLSPKNIVSARGLLRNKQWQNTQGSACMAKNGRCWHTGLLFCSKRQKKNTPCGVFLSKLSKNFQSVAYNVCFQTVSWWQNFAVGIKSAVVQNFNFYLLAFQNFRRIKVDVLAFQKL